VRFTRAIVCPPAATFAAGITTSGLGPPDLALVLEQHEAYCRTLERLGLSLSRLAPDPEFPDSTFVEDAAIVTSRGAILTRPGARPMVSRAGPDRRPGGGGRGRRVRGGRPFLYPGLGPHQRTNNRCRSTASEQIKHSVAWFGGYCNEPLDQADRLLRWVINQFTLSL